MKEFWSERVIKEGKENQLIRELKPTLKELKAEVQRATEKYGLSNYHIQDSFNKREIIITTERGSSLLYIHPEKKFYGSDIDYKALIEELIESRWPEIKISVKNKNWLEVARAVGQAYEDKTKKEVTIIKDY